MLLALVLAVGESLCPCRPVCEGEYARQLRLDVSFLTSAPAVLARRELVDPFATDDDDEYQVPRSLITFYEDETLRRAERAGELASPFVAEDRARELANPFATELATPF